jgi:hypothetical protein
MKKAILTILVFTSFINFTYSQKKFENKEYEFQIQEPDNWIKTNNQEILKNLEKFKISDENLNKFLLDHKGSILLTSFYKYDPKTHAGVVPTIQVNVRAKGKNNFENFKNTIIESAKGLKKYLQDFEYIKEPSEIEIYGIKSIYFISKFSMKTQKGQLMNVRSRTYAIPYKNYFFQVNFADDETDEDCNPEFDQLVKTIKIGVKK